MVLGLAAACSEPLPSVPPPTQKTPQPPGRGDFARQPFRAPLSIADAEQVLIRTKVFEFGMMPPKRQVQAFNLVLDDPDAGARFAAIAAQGEPAGRLYALCGFLALNLEASTTLASDLGAGGQRLFVIDSDVHLGLKTSAEMVRLIRDRRLWEEMRRVKDSTTKYFNKAG